MSFGYSSNLDLTIKSWASRLKSLETRVRTVEDSPLVGSLVLSDPVSDNQIIKYKEVDGVYINAEGLVVNASSAADGDVLVYDGTEAEWVNQATTGFTTNITTTGDIRSNGGTIYTDVIAEDDAGIGVTVDGVLLKDNDVDCTVLICDQVNLDEDSVSLDISQFTGFHLQCSDDWSQAGYLARFRNLDTTGSHGGGVFVSGGANSASSNAFAVQQLNGSNIFLCRGDGYCSINGTSDGTHTLLVSGSIKSTTLNVAGNSSALGNNSTFYCSSSNVSIASEVAGGSTSTRNHMGFRNSNGTVGSISTNGSATSFNTSSDARFKEDERPIPEAVGRVKQIEPKDFKWKGTQARSEGFMAQDVLPIAPYAVTEHTEPDSSTHFMIDYSKLVPLLWAAVRELTARIETLEAG